MERGHKSLEEEINRRRANKDFFSSSDIKDIVRPIYLQLKDLERTNFLHRNVKPSNILQNNAGLWKLSDTGILSLNTKSREIFDAPELE